MPVQYAFREATCCNMCGAPASRFQVLGKRLDQSQGANPHRLNGQTSTIVQCKSCDLIFANPMPVPASIQDHYGLPPEDYWVDEYFEDRPDYFQYEIDWLKRLKTIEPGMRSLDIGAGLGKQMLALKRQGFDTYGLEPSEPFYERAISKMGVEAERLQNLPIEEASFPDAHFDFVSFGVVLEHLYDPSESLQKVFRWLKPGGIVHIEVPHSKWLVSKIVNTYYRMRPGGFVANLSPMHPPFHLYEFSLKSFQQHAQRMGYTVKDHTVYVCKTYLPKVLYPILIPTMRYTKTGMQLGVWLEKPQNPS